MKWAFKTYDQSLKNLQKLVFAKCPELMGLLLYRFLSTNIFISISGTEVKTVHKFEHFKSILIGVGKEGGVDTASCWTVFSFPRRETVGEGEI